MSSPPIATTRSAAPQGLEPFGGQLRLRPGRPLPSIDSTRPDIAPRLTEGRLAHTLPGVLASVFTLCPAAHRAAARRAVAAAQGDTVCATDATDLRAATARDHVLRITHDWPRMLPGSHAGVQPMSRLRDCPLWQPDLDTRAQLAALPAWLEREWLDMPLAPWLLRHADEPAEWPARWSGSTETPLALSLRAQRVAARRLASPATHLDLLADPQRTMPVLARRMGADRIFCARPDWDGTVPDTGPWTRHRDQVRPRADDAWQRLTSRLVDLLHLAQPGGDDWLMHGALGLGGGEGVGWVEMARGLLVHAVRLVDSPEGPRVQACRVLAPTEWNFHPRGALARSLSALRGPAAADDARRLAVAFDPCVPFAVDAIGARGVSRGA